MCSYRITSFEFLCFWTLWVVPQFQAAILAARSVAPLQGAENMGCAGMNCFLYPYPLAGPSQPLFVYVNLSSVNNLNPVPRMEQCHFQRWEDCEHLAFCLSTESKQLKCFKRSQIRKLHKSNRESISWRTIYYRNSEGFLELHWP